MPLRKKQTKQTPLQTDAGQATPPQQPQKPQRPINRFYLRISNRFRVAKYVGVLCLVVFVLFMFTFYRESITIENFRFFLRYIDTRNPQRTDESIIKYDSSSVSSTVIYKGSIAVADSDSLQIYDLSGDNILSVTQHFSNPNLLASDQFILCYNTGGPTYRIYNSLSKLHEETLDYEISSASMNRSGIYAIVSKTKEYRSSVTIYGSDFSPLYQWFSPDKFVMDTAICDNNQNFLIAACATDQSGTLQSQILVCRLGEEEKLAEISLDDVMVLSLSYRADGTFTALCDDGLRYFSKDGTQAAFVSFDGAIPVKAGLCGEYSFYAVNRNVVGSEHTVLVFDKEGKILFDGSILGEITEYTFTNDALYLLLERQIVRISLRGTEVLYRDATVNGTGILTVDEKQLLLCFPEKTELIDIDALFFGTAE